MADTLIRYDTMSFPKVSIVTPSFNQAQFLEKTISSVIGQDYPNIEYIVIDGGSTDGSQEIIKKYEDRITYWVSEKDNGQSDAINKGLKKCTGEIVAWINSDDLYVEGAVSRAVKFFEEHPDTDLIHGDIDFIDKDGQFLFNIKTRDFTLPELLETNRIAQPTTFWKSKIFDDVGYLDEARHYIMDYDFWIRVAMKHRIRHIDTTIARFRLHNESKTVSRNDLFLIENLIMLDQLLSRNPEENAIGAIYTGMVRLLARFQFTDIASIRKYLDRSGPQKAVAVLGMAEYRSKLLSRSLRLSDLGVLKRDLRRLIEGYLEQYSGYRKYVTSDIIDEVVNDELFTIAHYFYDMGQHGKSVKLFLMTACLDARHLKYHNAKGLLKKYAFSGRSGTSE